MTSFSSLLSLYPKETPQSSAIVVGAGTMGLTAAIELRLRGWQVTLIEAGAFANPLASSVDSSRFIRADYGSDTFYTDLAMKALHGWEQWNIAFGERVYRRTGVLYLKSEPMKPGGFEFDSFDLLTNKYGLPIERLDNVEKIGHRFPAFANSKYVDGYFNPVAGWADSQRVIQLLVASAQRLGVTLLEKTPLGKLLIQSNQDQARVIGIETSQGSQILAPHVILCTGAWTPQILPELKSMMWPTSQPLIYLTPRDPTHFVGLPPFGADMSGSGFYGISSLDHVHDKLKACIKLGNHGAPVAGRVDPSGERTLEKVIIDQFQLFIRDRLPALSDAILEDSKVCYYCDTFDGHFWIDNHPQVAGLTVCAGGSGHAFKFAPIFGSLIADVVGNLPNPWKSRFAWRSRPDGLIKTDYCRSSADLSAAAAAQPIVTSKL